MIDFVSFFHILNIYYFIKLTCNIFKLHASAVTYD